MLVETLNAMFAKPLVHSVRGGAGHGGASLTAEGVQVLAAYRRLERKAAFAAGEEIAAIAALRSDMSGGK